MNSNANIHSDDEKSVILLGGVSNSRTIRKSSLLTLGIPNIYRADLVMADFYWLGQSVGCMNDPIEIDGHGMHFF